MHPVNRICTRRAAGRLRNIVALAAFVFALAPLAMTGTALAATTFAGGPDTDGYPLYVPDDHTAFAIKWSATGGTLTPGAQYYVKLRLNITAGTGGSAIRGWTFDSATGQWVQERDDWTKFPVVTADASGNVASTWMGCKFGDDAKAGTYYIIVSLTPLPYASGQTLNGTVMPAVTVFDMAAGGFWVHNGVATSAQATKRAEATDHADSTKVWALSRTETNLIDDDSNGVTDDEDRGPAGKTGDFRFALRISSFFDVFLNRSAWAAGQNVSGSLADVDIALGATDTAAPSQVSNLTVAARNGGADLSWDAASDDLAVTSYDVYRWTAATPIGGVTYYTPLHQKVATVTDTTWSDSGLTNDTPYSYEVRASDAATNVGPASTTAACTPDGTPPVTTENHDGLPHRAFRLTLTPADSGSGVLVTEYRIDGGSWIADTSVLLRLPIRHRRAGLAPGDHTVEYRSTDNAGNVEDLKSCVVTLSRAI